MRDGDPEAAFDLAKRTLKEHPADVSLLRAMGTAAWECGDARAAAGAFDQVLQRVPQDVEVRLWASVVARVSGDLSGARAHARAALEADAASSRGWLEMGRISREERDAAEIGRAHV